MKLSKASIGLKVLLVVVVTITIYAIAGNGADGSLAVANEAGAVSDICRKVCAAVVIF